MSEEQAALDLPEVATTDVDVTEPAETPESPANDAAVAESEPAQDPQEGETDDNEEPKRQSRAEKRINDLTRQRYEANQRAEALQAQLQAMQQQVPPAPVQTDEMPTLAAYDYDESRFQEAVQQWHSSAVERQQRQQQEQQQQQQMQQQQMQMAQKTQEVFQKGQAKYPDFTTTVNDPILPNLGQVSPAAFNAALMTDAPEEIAYYLAKNPQEIYRFAEMQPIQAVMAVAELNARLKTPAPKAETPPLNAPPAKVSGKATAKVDMSKLSTEDWMKERRRQLTKK